MAPATADSSLADADAFDSSAPASSASRLYRVEASLIRVNSQGERERLDQGARLALGDWLSLEFEASEGESIALECGSNITGWKSLMLLAFITYRRNEYLWIREAGRVTVKEKA